jgi:quinol-cytochrome oxidoreductase complex cytochrome b subunit
MDEPGSGADGLEPDVYPAPKGLWQRVQRSEVWRSAFRHPQLDTPRGRALQSFSNFFLHVYPVKVPGRVLRFRYSWRLGYILTVLFAITYLTGIYLMFFYTPSVASAYGDMQQLRTGIGFGQLVRNVHRWSAHLMVLVVVLHLARVFFAGAYKRPRQFNWVLGVGLLLATLGLSFSGYLLPWDQLSYWAVTVGTNLVNYVPALGRILRDLLLGGAQIGQATLLRFYALHVVVLPLALTVLLALHIWRVRKDGFAVRQPSSGAFAEEATVTPRRPAAVAAGGAFARPATEPPREPATDPPGGDGEPRVRLLGVVDRQSVTAEERRVEDAVFTWPHLLVRHVVVGLATAAVVLTLGVAFAAPLRGLANPQLTPEPSKAPWYFVGLQELLSHVDPLVAGVLVPIGTILALVLLPYMDRNPATEARNRKVAVLLFALLLIIATALTVIGALFRGPGWRFIPPWRHLYLEL